MKRLRLIFLLLIVLVAVLALTLQFRKSAPPRIPFAKVRRETLVSDLTTNGKVEPYQWVSLRAERDGLVARVSVERGQKVDQGAVLAELENRDARADVAAAEARLAQANADLQVIQQGGRSTELAEIESGLVKTRLDNRTAQRDYDSLRRLLEKQAATRQEVAEAQQRVQATENEIQALERRRAALVGKADLFAAQAKLKDAQAGLDQARQRLEQTRLRAPIAGVVYQLDVRPGSYLRAGDLVANVGRIDQVRVRVYVDEPELGRVAAGQPVIITWDALAGRKWDGTVEKMPTEIVTLGTRQVGEVLCTIANPGRELIPGTNVNADIRTALIPNALTIPKESIRQQSGSTGVYLLQGNKVQWRPVVLGAASVTRSQVLSGLSEGDSTALATEQALRPGEEVEPTYPQ